MYNRLTPKTEEKLRGILQVGDALDSPRFCWITLKEVFQTVEDMQAAGYTEPTYIDSDRWDIRGRSLSVNSMHFAAAPKMPLYTVEVTETLCKTFTVLAPNATAAEALVQQRYYDADDQEYVLSAENYLQTQFSVFPDADADPYLKIMLNAGGFSRDVIERTFRSGFHKEFTQRQFIELCGSNLFSNGKDVVTFLDFLTAFERGEKINWYLPCEIPGEDTKNEGPSTMDTLIDAYRSGKSADAFFRFNDGKVARISLVK